MFVSSGRIILDFYGNQNVKKKRSEMESLTKELHRKFNLSVKEIEDFDDPERCVLGIALVGSTQNGAQNAVASVLQFIDTNSFARMVFEDVETSRFSSIDTHEVELP